MVKKLIFSREEMFKLNRDKLRSRGVEIEDIAKIAFFNNQNIIRIFQW